MNDIMKQFQESVIKLTHYQQNQKTAKDIVPNYCPTVSLEDLSLEWISKAVIYFGGDKEAAAKALGISSRTIYHKFKRQKFLEEQGKMKSRVKEYLDKTGGNLEIRKESSEDIQT